MRGEHSVLPTPLGGKTGVRTGLQGSHPCRHLARSGIGRYGMHCASTVAEVRTTTFQQGGWIMTAVLVVEDDDSTRQALVWMLEDDGYGVTQAADGVAGLAALQASPSPLVVLLDHRLPALNGCDLLKLVK